MEDKPTLEVKDPTVISKAQWDKLLADHVKEKEEHAKLKAEHEDLKIKFGLAKKAYEWKEGDSRCPPVSLNGMCPECGWKWGSADPHPVSV